MQRTTTPALSIVIPAFNEERRLGASLVTLKAFLRWQRLNAEVLVVDDGSTDATATLVRKAAKAFVGLRLLSQPGNQGKGASRSCR